jgi:hypothetical protein
LCHDSERFRLNISFLVIIRRFLRAAEWQSRHQPTHEHLKTTSSSHQ